MITELSLLGQSIMPADVFGKSVLFIFVKNSRVKGTSERGRGVVPSSQCCFILYRILPAPAEIFTERTVTREEYGERFY